ncbi:hypothetical protein ACIO6T_40995 [Streptomyces sp. NPDC087532]|uniref:hypothetical protein n=1 Tax=Streptomyces sp. NPDC087532 TaxID=3365795 RepID=UPI00383058EF
MGLTEAPCSKPTFGRRFYFIQENEPVQFEGLPVWEQFRKGSRQNSLPHGHSEGENTDEPRQHAGDVEEAVAEADRGPSVAVVVGIHKSASGRHGLTRDSDDPEFAGIEPAVAGSTPAMAAMPPALACVGGWERECELVGADVHVVLL